MLWIRDHFVYALNECRITWMERKGQATVIKLSRKQQSSRQQIYLGVERWPGTSSTGEEASKEMMCVFLDGVLVFYYCHDKWPQMWCRKTTQIYAFSILKVGRLHGAKMKQLTGHCISPKAPREKVLCSLLQLPEASSTSTSALFLMQALGEIVLPFIPPVWAPFF